MNDNINTTDTLDFDHWMQLAKENPESFEAQRSELIASFLDEAPDGMQRRLRGLQWQVDQTRRRAATPMASCIAISNLMWDSLYRLNALQQELVAVTPGVESTYQPVTVAAESAATVLPFRAR